jgi:hypothetical protein
MSPVRLTAYYPRFGELRCLDTRQYLRVDRRSQGSAGQKQERPRPVKSMAGCCPSTVSRGGSDEVNHARFLPCRRCESIYRIIKLYFVRILCALRGDQSSGPQFPTLSNHRESARSHVDCSRLTLSRQPKPWAASSRFSSRSSRLRGESPLNATVRPGMASRTLTRHPPTVPKAH